MAVSGAGSIAALDDGYPADLKPYSNKKGRKAFNGLALAIIRSQKEKGEVVLRITSGTLKDAIVKIITQ